MKSRTKKLGQCQRENGKECQVPLPKTPNLSDSNIDLIMKTLDANVSGFTVHIIISVLEFKEYTNALSYIYIQQFLPSL